MLLQYFLFIDSGEMHSYQGTHAWQHASHCVSIENNESTVCALEIQ